MSKCNKSTSGGKGNEGKFIERDGNICAAGVPSAQAGQGVADALQNYLLKDEVDAIISDAIFPERPPPPLLPLRKPIPRDKRYTGVGTTLVGGLINPEQKTKFQILVEDVKNTPYKSYWKKRLGRVPDNTAMFPRGFDIEGTTYGKKGPNEGSLYDLICPLDPPPQQTPLSKLCGKQLNRKFCQPDFNPDLTYGHRNNIDKRGILMKCCLTDDRVFLGNANYAHMNDIEVDFKNRRMAHIGESASPNNNLHCVPEGHAFGKIIKHTDIQDCLSHCELESDRKTLKMCMAHLNSLRRSMSNRFPLAYFNKMYNELKYYDKEKTGWIPKEVVYDYCASQLIRLNPEIIEPLLSKWQAYNENNIRYKIFCQVLNYREALPDLPKTEDVPTEFLDFRTTYREMTKPWQKLDDSLRAGEPSGRYMDRDYPVVPELFCTAHRICLPQESDVHACIKPSVMTMLNVNHRDMYAKREPHVVRRVFEAAGEKFTDKSFNQVWEAAQKYHSQGWVCYETFNRALSEIDSTRKK